MAKAKKEVSQNPEVPETRVRAYGEHPNYSKAKEIFEVMPHVHSIWFDENGEWRFYETPGANPVHKHEVTAE